MQKVGKEVAEAEFNRFIESMDIDVSVENMTEEDKKSLEGQKSKIITAIENGSMTINDNGEPSYTTQRGKESVTITFYEPTGATLMAMDNKKKTEDVGKMYSAMADMTKTSTKTFANMQMGDLKVCMAVATLFLA